MLNRVYDAVHLQSCRALCKYLERGFSLYDFCVLHGDDHGGRFECLRTLRTCDDGHIFMLPFEKGGEVTVTPRMEWGLGVTGAEGRRKAKVRVHEHGRWRYIHDHDHV